jgi:hypothetical protein
MDHLPNRLLLGTAMLKEIDMSDPEDPSGLRKPPRAEPWQPDRPGRGKKPEQSDDNHVPKSDEPEKPANEPR